MRPEGAVRPGHGEQDHAFVVQGRRHRADGERRHDATAQPEFKGISLTLNPKTEAECERLFDALADGGQVFQPLIKTFFSPKFGVVADKFGVSWMVLVEQQPAKAA